MNVYHLCVVNLKHPLGEELELLLDSLAQFFLLTLMVLFVDLVLFNEYRVHSYYQFLAGSFGSTLCRTAIEVEAVGRFNIYWAFCFYFILAIRLAGSSCSVL